ncbi:sodium/calcium exchanger membrane protein [Rhodoferax ferrireducens T118]|uniref:Sodium/calcium exchanger membrane protein n=1 Tax=Albidiferax ferrireducens (strain ATCC BAA-621 / DSM 15236 / T118) TaxID=338969 RepID=Q21TW3_ALBFT|nr:cation transporter [Rhodoferax ferrireducens]ABD70790.1 sodium/calcium exchanger membrane protein [Rhodoferax ferrireducens T118]
MDSVVLIWLQFGLCVGVIGVAGVRLSRYGDALAALTGLSRNWVGLILLATVTSLPELVTGLSAVTVAAAPDIAVGDVLGSCVFNLAILAMIDVTYRKGAIYALADSGHIVSAGFGVILLAGVCLAVLLTTQGMMPSIGHVSLASVMIFVMYLVAIRALYLTEQRRSSLVVAKQPDMTLKAALMGYGVASATIVGAGIWLPIIGVELARLMGWSNSFVGTLFVAFATSVPELATTWGAIRISAIDMAIGNLLGSNLFDVLILAIDDFAYLPGAIYAHVSQVHAVSAITACLMSGVVIVSLAYRPVSRVWHIASWASLSLLALYLLNAAIQFLHGQ